MRIIFHNEGSKDIFQPGTRRGGCGREFERVRNSKAEDRVDMMNYFENVFNIVVNLIMFRGLTAFTLSFGLYSYYFHPF